MRFVTPLRLYSYLLPTTIVTSKSLKCLECLILTLSTCRLNLRSASFFTNEDRALWEELLEKQPPGVLPYDAEIQE